MYRHIRTLYEVVASSQVRECPIWGITDCEKLMLRPLGDFHLHNVHVETLKGGTTDRSW
jgi:hypothetical protein